MQGHAEAANERRKRRVVVGTLNFTNSLAWVPTLVHIALWTGVVTLPIASISVLVSRWLGPSATPWCILGVALFYAGMLRSWIRKDLRDAGSLWCVHHGFIVRPDHAEPHTDDRPLVPFRFADVGHVTFGRPRWITLRVGLSENYRIKTTRLAFEEDCDKIRQHLEATPEDTSISFHDGVDHTFTHPFTVAGLWAGPRFESLDFDAAGTRPWTYRVRSEDRTFEIHQQDLVLRGAEREAPILRLYRKRQVLFGRGTVIAMAARRTPETIEFRFGSGELLTVEGSDVRWQDVQVGTVADRCVRFHGEVPPLARLLAAFALVVPDERFGATRGMPPG